MFTEKVLIVLIICIAICFITACGSIGSRNKHDDKKDGTDK